MAKLIRQWSDNTNSALLDQVVATEALKRVTERAEDAQEATEGALESAWNRMEELFNFCNSQDENPNSAGADIVLVVQREGKEDQLIYAHKAILALSDVLKELIVKAMDETKGGAMFGTVLKVPIHHFNRSEEALRRAISMLYSGKGFRFPDDKNLARTDWKTGGSVPDDQIKTFNQQGALQNLDHVYVDTPYDGNRKLSARWSRGKMTVEKLENLVGKEAAKVHMERLKKHAQDKQAKSAYDWDIPASLGVLVDDFGVKESPFKARLYRDTSAPEELMTSFEVLYECTNLVVALRPTTEPKGFLSKWETSLSKLVRKKSSKKVGKQKRVQDEMFQRLARCDCVLRSSRFSKDGGLGWELPCHSFVLLAWSDVFKTLLIGDWNDSKVVDSQHRRVITVSEDIVPSKEVMQVLCTAMYTQSLSICGHKVQLCVDCRGVAEYYQLGPIVHGFDELLASTLNKDTCLGILDWSSSTDSATWVKRMAKRYLRKHFVFIFQNDELLADLSRNELEEAISSDFLQAEEWMVLETLLRWSQIRVNSGMASSVLTDTRGLIEHVRLPFITTAELERVFKGINAKGVGLQGTSFFPHFMWDERNEFQTRTANAHQGLKFICDGCNTEILPPPRSARGTRSWDRNYFGYGEMSVQTKSYRFRCTVCEDFDLCDKCFSKSIACGNHLPEHEMRPILNRADQIRKNNNPRFRLRVTDDVAKLIVETKKKAEEKRRLQSRMLEMRMSSSSMLLRMFHESNGRNNFDELAFTLQQVPPEAVVVRMLRREQQLRGAADYQNCVRIPSQNCVEVNRQIQLQVVREEGLSDESVEVIRSARALYPENSLMRTIPNYVRFNRSKPGKIQTGMLAENCQVYDLNGVPATLLDFKRTRRPLVIAAGSVT